jgi:hypothetical protein
MKINANISKIEITDSRERPNVKNYKMELFGQCTAEQFQAVMNVWGTKGSIEIEQWDGIEAIFGIRIVLSIKDDE